MRPRGRPKCVTGARSAAEAADAGVGGESRDERDTLAEELGANAEM